MVYCWEEKRAHVTADVDACLAADYKIMMMIAEQVCQDACEHRSSTNCQYGSGATAVLPA